jgi:hypothetical protein
VSDPDAPASRGKVELILQRLDLIIATANQAKTQVLALERLNAMEKIELQAKAESREADAAPMKSKETI